MLFQDFGIAVGWNEEAATRQYVKWRKTNSLATKAQARTFFNGLTAVQKVDLLARILFEGFMERGEDINTLPNP